MDLLNHSFGSGGMTCGLDQNMLPYFIQNLKRQGNLCTKKAIMRPGLQEGSKLYFLNENTTIDEDGELQASHADKYLWLKKELVHENDKILVCDICPNIKTPLSPLKLYHFFVELKACLKHNFIPSLLVIAGAAMAFHYSLVVSLYGGCSIIVASGPAATGKTTAIKAGLGLFGSSNNNIFVKGTNRGFLERSSISSIPYGIDDPRKGRSKSKANLLDIPELLVDLYNGSPTANYSTGILKPLSVPLVATNFEDVNDEDRHVSQLSLIFVLIFCLYTIQIYKSNATR